MRKVFWLGFALIAMAAIVGEELAMAQKGGPPDKFGKGPKGKGDFVGKGKGARPLTVDDTVSRIMALDKNNDGKIVSDELPERMQHLIAAGDGDKDGALVRDEVRKLATTLEAFLAVAAPTGPGPGGPPGKGGFGPPGPLGRALDDLNISDVAKRDQARRFLKEHQDKVRQAEDELLKKMRDVLSEEEFRTFREAVDRRPPFKK